MKFCAASLLARSLYREPSVENPWMQRTSAVGSAISGRLSR